MSDAIDRMFEKAAEDLRDWVDQICEVVKNKIGSPIEELFLVTFITWRIFEGGCEGAIFTPSGHGGWRIIPQAQIGKYRVDFLIEEVITGSKIVVECDGHDFHERTKEQAERDRKRDRKLQSEGYFVMRFTGSELHRDPMECVHELHSQVSDASMTLWQTHSNYKELSHRVWDANGKMYLSEISYATRS